MKRFAVHVVLVFVTVACAVLLWQFREAILLFTLALAGVATLRPTVDFLVAREIRRPLAVAITCLGALAFLAAGVVLCAPLLSEAQSGANELLRAYDSASGSQESLLRQLLAERLPASVEIYRALGSRTPGSGAQAVLGVAMGTLSLFGRGVLVLVMSIYWLANRDAFEHWGLSLLSSRLRVRARETWRAVKAGVGMHLRAQLARSLLAVVILDLGFHALGLRYPTLPAVTGGLGLLVPVVGVPFALLSAIAAGLADGPVQAAAAGLLAAATFTLIAVIGARAFPLRRNNAILEIIAIMALADAFGAPGLFAAAPLAAAIRILAGRLLFAPASIASEDLSGVARRLAALRERIAVSRGTVSPELARVLDRLDGLVSSAQFLDEPS